MIHSTFTPTFSHGVALMLVGMYKWLALGLSILFGSVSHVVTRSYKDQSSNVISLQETVNGNAEINLDDAALAVTANHHYVINITRANLQSLCISASGPVTVYTNAASGGSPTDTIPIAAGQVLEWTLATDGLSKCPISADITAGIYVTNAGASSVAFKVRSVVNQ